MNIILLVARTPLIRALVLYDGMAWNVHLLSLRPNLAVADVPRFSDSRILAGAFERACARVLGFSDSQVLGFVSIVGVSFFGGALVWCFKGQAKENFPQRKTCHIYASIYIYTIHTHVYRFVQLAHVMFTAASGPSRSRTHQNDQSVLDKWNPRMRKAFTVTELGHWQTVR